MRVTSKGQVTIPIELRRKYGIGPGADVEFVEGDRGPLLRLCPVPPGQPGDLVRALRKARTRVTHRLTTDQIMELMRGSDHEPVATK